MATLNLNEKKIPSAENLRLIAQLCISLANKQSSLEDRCIAPWKSGEVYQKDISYVSYNNYLYFCTVSNSDIDFVESHWTKLSDTISELTKADIEALINLTPEQITNLQSLIDDTSISTTHTNSSSHIYMAIQDAIAECKDDTLKQIAKKVSGSYKIANTTADIVSADYIYLLSNGTNYDLYVLVDGTATKVGDTNIDLSEYVKITDLADYMKTSDADGKFATITTVDGKVNKTDIVDNLTSTDTDKPLSANQGKVLKDEVDLKANDSEVVKKTDISTTIDKTSTDNTVPTNKAVYDATSNFRKTYTSIEQLGLTSGSETMENIANNMESFTRLIAVIEGDTSIYPYRNGTLIVEKLNIYRVHFKFCVDESPVVYVGTYHAISGFTGWKRLCSTSVADVPLTNVTIPDGIFQSVNEVSYIKYEVVNGIAFVYFNIREAKFVKSGVSRNITVPKIKSPFNHTIIGENINTNLTILANGNNMQLWALGDETMVTHYSACISYPVAES